MKLKNILLILIVIVIIPEILLVTYVFNINIEIPNVSSGDFLTFLISNPIFLMITLIITLVMIILYFALQVR